MNDSFAAILELSNSELETLSRALRSGRIVAESAETSLQNCIPVGPESGRKLAACLSEWMAEGMQPNHIATLLEGMVAARRSQPRISDEVELVWTGTEAAGMVNRDAAVVLRELFGQARESILVAGFAIYGGRAIFEELARRMKDQSSPRTRLCLNIERKYGDTTRDSELVRRFLAKFRKEHWPAECILPEMYYDPRSLALEAEHRASLHAKCVVVDGSVALVTSANFTDAALRRNIEVGALIRSTEFAARLAGHFDELIRSGSLKRIE